MDLRARRGQPGAVVGGGGFQRYGAGKKHYGTGRTAPNVGGVDNAAAAAGYNKRDVLAASRRNALLKRMGGFGRGF